MAGANECCWCGGYLGERYIAITIPQDPKYEARFCSQKCVFEYTKAGKPVVTCYKKEKGGCFITTAVCQTLNKPDDCVELTAMRDLRDNFMQETKEMREEIKEYYLIAPQICAEIEKAEDSVDEIYMGIWEKYLKQTVEAVQRKNYQIAHDIYKQMVLDLKREYLR